MKMSDKQLKETLIIYNLTSKQCKFCKFTV